MPCPQHNDRTSMMKPAPTCEEAFLRDKTTRMHYKKSLSFGPTYLLNIEVQMLRCVQGMSWEPGCGPRGRKSGVQFFRVYFVPRGPQTGSAAWIFMRRGRSRQRCVYFCLAILCAQGWLSRKNKTNTFTCHNTRRRTNSWIPRARRLAPGLIPALTHGKFLAPSSKAMPVAYLLGAHWRSAPGLCVGALS